MLPETGGILGATNKRKKYLVKSGSFWCWHIIVTKNEYVEYEIVSVKRRLNIDYLDRLNIG